MEKYTPLTSQKLADVMDRQEYHSFRKGRGTSVILSILSPTDLSRFLLVEDDEGIQRLAGLRMEDLKATSNLLTNATADFFKRKKGFEDLAGAFEKRRSSFSWAIHDGVESIANQMKRMLREEQTFRGTLTPKLTLRLVIEGLDKNDVTITMEASFLVHRHLTLDMVRLDESHPDWERKIVTSISFTYKQ